MARSWTGDGPAFEIEWGGRTWTLRVDGDRPGLTSNPASTDGTLGPLLALAGVAEVGRADPGAFSGSTLVGFERRLGRVEATYAPPGWAELTVRAAWAPHEADGLDLEVQVSTASVGRLRRVEILVESGLAGSARPEAPRLVEPRDARSAGLSYDGREPDVAGLTTLPPRPPAPLLCRLPDREGSGPDAGRAAWYAEFVHPQDATRRIAFGTAPARSTRYGLFGYDLEKGVVLRARLRGLWLPSGAPRAVARDRYEAFLREPPPLMT